jgi:hypothetical protein
VPCARARPRTRAHSIEVGKTKFLPTAYFMANFSARSGLGKGIDAPARKTNSSRRSEQNLIYRIFHGEQCRGLGIQTKGMPFRAKLA